MWGFLGQDNDLGVGVLDALLGPRGLSVQAPDIGRPTGFPSPHYPSPLPFALLPQPGAAFLSVSGQRRRLGATSRSFT